MKENNDKSTMTRREFINLSAVGVGGIMVSKNLTIPTQKNNQSKKPNIVFIITDQQGLDTLSAFNCKDVKTPNMDRLKRKSMSFELSYSTNPICSPARSSLFTGRMPSETSVIKNGLKIREDIPNIGEWLSKDGYKTVYVGKWHLPHGYQKEIKGFEVFPAGEPVRGSLGDQAVSGVCDGFLRNYNQKKPFLLVASFLQPHDICNWIKRNKEEIDKLPFEDIKKLPELPPNFEFNLKESKSAHIPRQLQWNELNWRYYLWSYYRMVEEVDKEIGRVLDAVEQSSFADNTMIIFTSDHGEGRARHKSVTKNFLYEEAVKVPLMISFPKKNHEGVVDKKHLVSGLDIFGTICDYANVPVPSQYKGLSLRPLLEQKTVQWRDFVVSEVQKDKGRMIRNERFKLIVYRNDSAIQLFDLQNDPWEKTNLAGNRAYHEELLKLKVALEKWEQKLDKASNALGPFQVSL